MFGLIYYRNVGGSTARLLFLVRDAVVGSSRWFSSVETVDKYAKVNDAETRRLFVVSYLVNSCGFSLGDAMILSKKRRLAFDSPERPDSVLNFLKNNSFSDSHIRKVVRTCPQVLSSNADAFLSPKLSFFRSVGFSDDDIVGMFTLNPVLFITSLKNKLIPWHSLLKSILVQDAKITQCLKRSPYMLCLDPRHDVAPKISALREIRVPDFLILRLLRYQPRAFSMTSDKFDEIVKKIVDMGINPATGKFVNSFGVFRMKKATLEGRVEAYKESGLSEDEIWSIFKKNPQFMTFCEKLIRSKMDFLRNKMGFQLQSIARYPSVLNYSLEKRIVPCCSVIRVLELKGLINLGNPLCPIAAPDHAFLKCYVEKYLDQVPELLDIYHGKTSLEELALGFEQKPLTEKTLESSTMKL